MERFVSSSARILKNELGLSADDEAVLSYSIQILITTVLGYLFIIVSSAFFGSIGPALAGTISMSGLRVLSGGAHFSSPWRCITGSTIIFTMLGISTRYLLPIKLIHIFSIVLVVFLVAIYTIYRFAPADTPGKPIATTVQRHKLKMLSYVVVILWFFLLMLVLSFNLLPIDLVLGSVLGVLWQAVTVSPVGYRITHFLDKLLMLFISK